MFKLCFFNAPRRDKVGTTQPEATRIVCLFAMLSETFQKAALTPSATFNMGFVCNRDFTIALRC